MTDHHRRPREPAPEPDKVAEGSAKQFARGVGEDHVDELMAADPRPTETVKTERVPAGSGKQFARGVGEPGPTEHVHEKPSDALDEASPRKAP
jgi:hypothetical protein